MTRQKIHPLLKRLLLFCVIFIGINGVITAYFYRVSIHNHKLLTQDRGYHQSGDSIELLIMGHSRPFKAIDPSLLPNAVNFCSGGESNIHTYYKLKYALERSGKEIKIVLLPAGFPSFNVPDPQVNSNSFYWKQYVDYFELAQLTGEHDKYVSVWLKSHTIPWYEYGYLKLSSSTGDFDLRVDKEDFLNGSKEEKLNMANLVIERTMGTRSFYDEVSLEYLKKTIKLCQQHKCQLVFIKYPVSSSYREATQAMKKEYKLLKGELKADSIIQSYSDVHFWNYSNYWSEDDSFFADPQHVNIQGQKTFTNLVKRRLKEL